MAGDARITITVDGGELASATFAKVSDTMKGVGDTTGTVSAQAQANFDAMFTGISDGVDSSAPKISELGKHVEDLKPSTDHAHAAFTDLKGTLDDMWENPRAAVGKLAGAVSEELAGSLGTLGVAAGMAVGALAAVGAAAYELVENTASVGSAIERASLITGISADNMSALKFAADVTGGSLDQLTNMAFMLERRLGDTGATGDKTREALAALGITANDFATLPVDEQVLKISEGFRGLGEDVNKATIAYDLLGRQGRDALPTLLQPMDELVKKAHDLGLTWSNEDAKAAHEFEVETGILHAELSKFAIDIGKDLLPMAIQLADALDRLFARPSGTSTAPGTFIDSQQAKIASDALKAVKDDADRAGVSLEGLSIDIHTPAAAMPGLIKAAADVAAKLHEIPAALADTGPVFGQFVGDLLMVQGHVKDFGEMGLGELQDRTVDLSQHLEDMGAAFQEVDQWVPPLTASVREFHDGITIAGDTMTTVTIPAFSTLLNVVAGATKAIKDATGATNDSVTTTDQWTAKLGGLSTALSQLANVSGGTFGGIVQELATVTTALNATEKGMQQMNKAGATTSDKIAGGATAAAGFLAASGAGGVAGVAGGALSGAEIGAEFGPWGAAIGAVGGALVGLGRDLFGVSQAEKDARTSQDAMITSLQGMATQGEITEGALTDNYHTIAIVGRDAFMTAGASASQADTEVKALLNTSNPAAFATAMKNLDTVMASNAQHAKDVQTAVTSVVTAAHAYGTDIPKDMQATIAQLELMPGLTDAEKASLQGLVDAAKPNYDQLTTLASNYGITLEGLGPKFQQANIDSTAKTIFKDFTDLTSAGADTGGVLLGMSGKILDLVTHSREFGEAIPENMKPLIESLEDSTALSDDFKKNLGLMSDIKFEDTPVDQGLTGMQTSLDTLKGTLTGPDSVSSAVKSLLDSIPNNPFANWVVPGGSGAAPPSFANEGYDLTSPMRAIVGDNPLQSESVLHASTVKDIVRASRAAPGGSSSGGSADMSKLHATVEGLRADLKRQADAFNNAIANMPISIRHAMRGAK